MAKQAPSPGRIAVAVGFSLSCFGLLLFLWVSFGGPIPLKPEGYRFTTKFPEATTLAVESDVRIAGVNVGKVKTLEVDPTDNRTIATIQLDEAYAPLPEDSRAILRAKTLLGETYVELTPGTNGAKEIPEGGRLERTQVRDQVAIDEIFEALDSETRQNFRDWQRFQGEAIEGRGVDLNDVFGNLGPFADDGAAVLETLRRQDRALKQLVRNTGVVFGALTENESALSGVITNSNQTFRALASQDEALRETFQVFPTFLDESRRTLARLQTFSNDTHPLIRDLRPVARQLSPTLIAARRLSPDLRELFGDLDALIDVSDTGLPATRRFVGALRPLMPQLDAFLANLNPVLRFLEFNKANVADFFNSPAGIAGALSPVQDQPAPRRALRVNNPITAESLALWPTRLRANRGNQYLLPGAIGGSEFRNSIGEAFPSFDCRNNGGELRKPGTDTLGPCTEQEPFPEAFGGEAGPQVSADR